MRTDQTEAAAYHLASRVRAATRPRYVLPVPVAAVLAVLATFATIAGIFAVLALIAFAN